MISRQLITGLLGIWILGTNSVVSFYSPQHVMVDVTNDFGVCVLQLISSKKENIAFSPYGLVSVALVLYEGSTGPSAAEIHNTLRLPWDREVTRVGFRDMHRYLKSYFSNDGFLRGLVLSKPNIMLRKNYTDLLQFYGFDVRTSPPQVPTTPVPPVLTTAKPASSPPTKGTAKPPKTTTMESGKTTPPPKELDSRFGTTTTEMPKQQTTLTTLKGPETTMVTQTSTPAFRTTGEKITKVVVTTPPSTKKTPAPTTTTTTTTTTTAETTKPPTTKTMTPPSTTLPPTTKSPPPPTTTTPATAKPPPQSTTTTAPPTTKAAPPTTTPPSPTTTTKTPTTKSADSTQLGTTLDVVTMTDKKPNTPEIMSQVNMSATATTGIMEGREGDSDMDIETTKLDTTTTSKPTTVEIIATTPTEAPQTQSTILDTTDTVEVSISETTVSKSMSMVDPNTTPMPSTLPQETTTEPGKTEIGPVTLLIETTTPPATMVYDTMAEASESDSQGTTMMLPEGTTMAPKDAETHVTSTEIVVTTPGVLIPVPTESPPQLPETVPSVVTTGPPLGVGGENIIPVATIPTTGAGMETVPTSPPPVEVVPAPPLTGVVPENVPPNPEASEATDTIPVIAPASEALPPVAVTIETALPVTATTAPPEQAIQAGNLLLQSPMAFEERMDTEAIESQKEEALARQQRSLFSTPKTPEYQKSGSNWVPRYHDHRWGQTPSNEFWFFTFTGGENVPAHTYTAYLPFAFVPELSSLAIQLPLDDPRYSILILLPEERLGLSQLLYSLQWCPVRAILTHLKMTAVYAVVPAFTIVKHINLVPALAKMGIHSVFDPFRADLSPMTTEPHLFVRTIEQVVTVSLRKYYPSNRWFEASPNEVRQHFVANHPFAYFVLDRETDVTLMAGTIVNPVAHNQ